MKNKCEKRIKTWEVEVDPSVRGLEDESAEGLGEALVDSERAGQEAAPITEPDSTTPFESLFQAGFFDFSAMPLSLPLELSAAEELSIAGGGEEGAGAGGEQSEKGICSDTVGASEDRDDDDEGRD